MNQSENRILLPPLQKKLCRFAPVLDRTVEVYVMVTLFFQVLLQISPAVTFLAYTPLYSIQTYLGLLGLVLIGADALIGGGIWRGKYCWLLYGIWAFAALASLRMLDYGLKENLFKLCWAAIQFALMYSLAWRPNQDRIRRNFKRLYGLLLTIWVVACLVSLYQYVAQIGYMAVINPLAVDSSATRQGFVDNRLFGIFYTLNHAAYISLMLFLLGIFFFLRSRNRWVKVLLLGAELILLSHILLSGSRSAYVSLMVCVFWIAWMLLRKRCCISGWRNEVALLLAVVIFAMALGSIVGLKALLEEIPGLFHENFGDTGDFDKVPPEDDLLHREDLEADQSNGRLSIWKDYVSLYRQVGLVGLSPGNYMPYIYEHHPQLYIVEYIRQNYPDKYASGIIYHVHSGYMMVYVSAGIAGFALLAVFMALCVRRMLRKIKGNRSLHYLFIGAAVLVAAGAVSAMFDEGLFFQNMPHTTLFWLALGVLMRKSAPEDEK